MMMMMTFFYSKELCHTYTLATRGCGCDKNDKNDLKKRSSSTTNLKQKNKRNKKSHATLDRFFGRTAPPPKSRRSSPRPREKKD